MPTSFSEKQITVEFALASGQFEGGGNTATVTGLRVEAQIDATFGASNSSMTLAIYGMRLSTMQQLANVGPDWSARYRNGVRVLAGDVGGLQSLVFDGVAYLAYIDGAQPNVHLRVLGAPGAFLAVQPASPISINGSIAASDLMSRLAADMGLQFQNAGVTARLSGSPYYYGSAWSQAYKIANDGGFDVVIDRGVMTIIARDGARDDAPIDIGPTTGLVGYPSFSQNYIVVRCLFNPSIQVGSVINVTSSLTPACGKWKVIQYDLDLQAVVPGGNWFMTIQATQVTSP